MQLISKFRCRDTLDKLAAGVVITGGGALLKNLPQLVNFKTAMDVRIGYPNEHLHGEARNEINQPMFATSVGLIMKGFEFLDNYKQEFSAGQAVDKPKAALKSQPQGKQKTIITRRKNCRQKKKRAQA